MFFKFVRYMTFLGNAFPQGCICLLLCFIDLHQGIQVSALWGGAYCINFIVKNTVRKPRPNPNLHRVKVKGWSFASGHALTSFVLYTSIAKYFLVPEPWSWFLYAMPVALGLSRLYLRVHYPEDVFGGWIIAYMYLNFLETFVSKIAEFVFAIVMKVPIH
jgi:undecaprenyl-diphosphatase